MPTLARASSVALTLLVLLPAAGRAQTAHPVGARAQGMAGAFVGVADDASAVYWNPAGLAGGAYFSLLVDGNSSEAVAEDPAAASSRSAWLLALTTPALGLSYYRLQTAVATPLAADAGSFRLESLATHHVGGTVVQSLTDHIAVAATLKGVRGVAASADVRADDAEGALSGWDLMGQGHTRFDLDFGVMATGTLGRLGLVVRNATAPSFETGEGAELRLERQVRAGGSVSLLEGWILAADLDLTRNAGPLGDVREFALGTEKQLTPRLAARTGFRLNAAGDRGRTPGVSVGGSYAVFGSLLLDAQLTAGSDDAYAGWGVAGRVVF